LVQARQQGEGLPVLEGRVGPEVGGGIRSPGRRGGKLRQRQGQEQGDEVPGSHQSSPNKAWSAASDRVEAGNRTDAGLRSGAAVAFVWSNASRASGERARARWYARSVGSASSTRAGGRGRGRTTMGPGSARRPLPHQSRTAARQAAARPTARANH